MKHIIFLSIVLCFCDNVMYNNYVERILFELPNNITDDLNSEPMVEYEVKEKKDDNIDINKDVRHWNIEINEHKDNPNIQRNPEGNDNNHNNENNDNWEYHSNYNDEKFESQNENERNGFSLKNEVEKNPEERKDTPFDEYNEYANFENMNNNFEKNKKKYFEDMQSTYMEDKKNVDNKEYMDEVKNKKIEYQKNEENNIKNGIIQYNDNLSFDYSKHGMDWNVGICKNGKYQSPVDLHMHTLKERELKNLSDFYLNAFYDNDEYSWNNYNKPWFKGDIFYYYENLINKIIINRQNNMFKIKASNNEIIPFGVLFTTDEPAIFYSHHINFHSPSEHTFEGSGNRRHIEMQIYHSTNEIYDYDENKWNGVFGKKTYKKKNNETNIQHSYILTFLMNSLSNPHLSQQYTKNKKRNKRSKSYNSIRMGRNDKNTKRESQYQVISITFSSAEIDKSTINNFKKLPSEKFLKTILEGSQNVPVGSGPKLVNLKEPLNLNSLLMMLNMKSMEFFAYHGSSTSPGCNENVHWKVAKKSLPISTETMLKFYNMLKKTTPYYNASDNDNFRALQNVQGNIHNYGRVYLIQGFPVQLLISSALMTSDDKNVIENIKLAYSKSSANYIYFNFIFLLLIFMFLQNY
ncbi:carbonic anhydrase, putative [Plasmodium berghei]|uniref:Carbonic anhydrase, putative n=3 Tax=Plasmodium berghei TaxID=5821 RepID=A0A509ALC9_PLABA|nr:carbonic anhydrase, putative [Plasmodium berghei ANKA]CXI40810.1 carbonic anhydrase, putative [Plasmodium berghei]SCO60112.1 carbonic anhydrase, putative [Plasmodium berghei]VUC55631.1 carbonic anhydrase, putative [Plasmodium berghei ANKA]|eukprot:XP_034421441.1 carbonic anhydrase, putative [Plasmodium berghei ANKA]